MSIQLHPFQMQTLLLAMGSFNGYLRTLNPYARDILTTKCQNRHDTYLITVLYGIMYCMSTYSFRLVFLHLFLPVSI